MTGKTHKGLLPAFRHMTPGSRALLICCLIVLFLVCGLITGLFSYILGGGLRNGSPGAAELFLRGILHWSGLRFTLPMFLFTGFFLVRLFSTRNVINYVDETGKYGEQYMKNGTFGSARFMTKAESGKYYDVDENINEHFGMVFGRLKEEKS